jgi:hypothetical protein
LSGRRRLVRHEGICHSLNAESGLPAIMGRLGGVRVCAGRDGPAIGNAARSLLRPHAAVSESSWFGADGEVSAPSTVTSGELVGGCLYADASPLRRGVGR